MAKAKSTDSDAMRGRRRSPARSVRSSDGTPRPAEARRTRLPRRQFEAELLKLQRELVIMQEYVRAHGLKVVVIFEGRDAAGKGGVIKRIAERMNSSYSRSVQNPITRSTPARLYHERSNRTISPAAGRC